MYASVAEANPKQIHVMLSEPIKDANTFTGLTVKADSQVVTIDSIDLVDTNKLVINLLTSGTLEQKQRIQKLVFPEGIRIDTKKCQYLTSKVNLLFREKRLFIGDTEGDKKKPPPKTVGCPT